MSWTNTKRARRIQHRRSDYHQDRIEKAETSRQKLSAACGWLISEAWQAGQIAEVQRWVLEKVDEIRKENRPNDSHGQ